MAPSLWAARLPWSLVAIALLLIAAGLIGIARCEALFAGSGGFLRRQALWSLLAIAAMLAITWPNYRILCRWSYAILAATLLLLCVVYLFPPINGAHRWIRLGPVGFQPSELAKVAFIVALARYLMYRDNYRRLRGLLAPLALTLVPVVLILREPDLGTALVFLPVLFLMLLAAGAKLRDLALVALLGLLALPLLWTQMSGEQRSRVTALFHQSRPGERPTSDGYHLHQSKQMLALGGVWGSAVRGTLLDDRAVYHLPEAQTDFIFCILGERFGLLGTGGVLLLYALLVWRAFLVAESTREPFGRLVAVGVGGLYGVEVLVNTAMTVGLAPITGLSLPLVSYGGSGLLAHAIALGLLLNVALRPGYEVGREPFRTAPGALAGVPRR